MAQSRTVTGSDRPAAARLALVIGLGLGYVLLLPFLLRGFTDIGSQAAVAMVAAAAFGFTVGRLLAGAPTAVYAGYGAALGVGTWVGLLLHTLVVFDPPAYPALAWFVRFGMGTALVVIASSLLGSAVSTGRLKPTSAAVASAAAVAALVVSLFKH